MLKKRLFVTLREQPWQKIAPPSQQQDLLEQTPRSQFAYRRCHAVRGLLLPGPGYEISHSFCQRHSGTVSLHLADPGDVADAVNDVAGAGLAVGPMGPVKLSSRASR